MQIEAIGHAGMQIHHGDMRVLLDPWFNPEGAFQGSWFQFPRNDHLLSPELLSPDVIVISHEHMDHVDPWFLARVPADVPVVIPKYPSPALTNKILLGGERPVVEVEPWEKHDLGGGLSVFFVSEESPMNHDSAMIVEAGGDTLVNLNDARMSPAQLRRIKAQVGGTIEALVLQGAGASWFPICYDYPPDREQELSRSKRSTKLKYVERVVGLTEPAVTFPMAGPPCFLDEELRQYNVHLGPDGIFPTQDQVEAHLRQRGRHDVVTLLPGDVWDTGTAGHTADPHWNDFSFEDRDEYIDDYARIRQENVAAVVGRHESPPDSQWPAFRTYFERLLSMSDYFNEKIGMRVGFDILGQGTWAVDFRKGQEAVLSDLKDCHYQYRFDGRWLPPLLNLQVPWEDFFLSLRFGAYRNPDLYNDHLLGLLKFAFPEALDAVHEYETADHAEATIRLEVEGTTYEIQRYCPHAGQDLAEAAVLLPGGIIQCLGHHYEFDLASGACLNGTSRPLETKVIAKGES